MGPQMPRLTVGLNAATVLLVAAGILLLVVPSPVPARRGLTAAIVPVNAASDTVRHPSGNEGDAADRVIRTNIFSPRRTAPAQRYVFGELAQESETGSADVTIAPPLAGESLDSTMASTATDVVPHLYGTMLGPAEATALLRLDARAPEPRLYRVGDTAGGYRVAEIADRSVALVGRSGRVVLRLARPDQ
jgi:hypothetical protein